MRVPVSLLPPPDHADLTVDEFERQRDVLDEEKWVRLCARGLAFGISMFFLPGWLVVLLASCDLAGELLVHHLQRDIPRLVANRRRYRVYLAVTFQIEASFALPAGLMWHIDDPYVKSFAVGMMAGTMLHVAMVRSIHLAMGLTGAAAICAVTLISNATFWIAQGEPGYLLVTTFCAITLLGYFLSALMTNHHLHRATAQGRADARAANDAKSRFLAQMSHELRTPLNAIMGIAHAELAQRRDPRSQRNLSLIIDSTRGLCTVLDDILDMSAMEEGAMPIRPVPVRLDAEIAATVALFRAQVEAAGLTLVLSSGRAKPDIARVDDQRLRQCLYNLLSNALKHTSKGGVRVEVGGGPGLLQIEISDTGAGIDPALRNIIFQPFNRGPGQHSGTGLGLSITRSLAQRMGGDLVLLPSASGAVFRLTLALAAATEADLPANPKLPPVDLTGRHILVVDDIATNRLVAATYLRSFGATVREASSGDEALIQVAGSLPDMILLDMNMPGLSGVQTLHQLRSLGHEVPVIAMTADATEAHRAAYLAEGLDGYVAKPLSPEALSLALRPHLRDLASATRT